MKIVIDTNTGESVELPLDKKDLAEIDAARIQSAKDVAEMEEQQAKAATDKASLLAKLGITADEAKLLLS